MPTNVTDSKRIQLRCPIGPKKLLGAMRIAGKSVHVNDGNLMELSCRSCRMTIEQEQGKRPAQVVHLYNVLGDCVESEIHW